MRLINSDDLIERINAVIENGLADHVGLHPVSAEVVLETINVIPTATPDPHWIPCSERLPKTDTWRTTYIVTTDNGIVTAMEWENTTVRGKSTSRWIWHDRLSPWGVIAWMPMPAPWKGE